MKDEVKLSESTSISLPIRNLIALIGFATFSVYWGFGVLESINRIDTKIQLMESDLQANTEFRIKWPRGELGSLPADSEQFMLIEYIGTQIQAIQDDLKDLPKDRSQDLTIDFFEDRILKLEDQVEDLKDKVRANGNH
jgi:hypothetical protein